MDHRGGLVIFGHGSAERVPGAAEANRAACPLANPDGEDQARKWRRTGDKAALMNATATLPTASTGTLRPAAPGSKAPEVWEGEPLSGRTVGQVPARHVHPEIRADLLRLQALSEEATRLRSAARQAKMTAADGPTAARKLVAEAAASRNAVDGADVNRIIRERQEEAATAELVAEGTADAVNTLRRRVAAGIAERRPEWLAYLHGQAVAELARLDLVVKEPSRLFVAGSTIAGRAVQEVRETRERAASALWSLERHSVLDAWGKAVTAASAAQRTARTPREGQSEGCGPFRVSVGRSVLRVRVGAACLPRLVFLDPTLHVLRQPHRTAGQAFVRLWEVGPGDQLERTRPGHAQAVP
ncbi:hypothetical protein [Micromonospora sp. WMMD1102]|uniref:hypothetical protein n=1 Tax=Micromonospora sp. WMMD1102 TaxID=3016105 RepID=UPI003241C8C0